MTRARVKGMPELMRKLDRLERDLTDERRLTEPMQAAADVLAEEWRRRVPVDQGDYRDSIQADAQPGRDGATALVRITDPEVAQYAPRLEFGDSTRPAQPSFRAAVDGASGRAQAAAEFRLRQLIERAT